MMLCCSLIVAFTLSMGYGEMPNRATGFFSTPMFLMGRPVWVTPVSRRQLRLKHSMPKDETPLPETDVAVLA